MTLYAALMLAACSSGQVISHDDDDEHVVQAGTHRHWAVPPEAARRANPISPSAQSLAQGGRLFKKHCAECHGKSGRGDGPRAKALATAPVDLAFMANHHPDGDLAWKIEHGRSAMPAWGDVLPDDQIWHIVNHIRHELANQKSEPESRPSHEEHRHGDHNGHNHGAHDH